MSAAEDEVAALRARVAALEAELAEQARRANAAVAAAEDRAYWLERYHVDLDRVMRPGVVGVLEGLRRVARRLRR